MFFKFLNVFNRAGWPEYVQVDTLRLMMMIDTSDKRTAYRARDGLVDAKFLSYDKGSKGKPSRYYLLSQNATVYATVNATLSGTENGTQNGTRLYTNNINNNTIEKKKTKKKIYCSESISGSGPKEPPVILLPLNDGTEYPVTKEQFKELQGLYPAVDIMQQLRNMRGWCLSNPSKRKTKRGINSFMNRWLSKEQDSGKNKNGGNNSGLPYL